MTSTVRDWVSHNPKTATLILILAALALVLMNGAEPGFGGL